MKILVTGFDAFGGESLNPASEIVRSLPDEINGAEIIRLTIPTVRYRSTEMIVEAIERTQPDAVLSLGQAGGRAKITVERIGINLDDQRIADNEGNQVVDEPIYEDGEDAYFATLPVRKIVEGINAAGIPAEISNTAGTFICNHVLYGVRYWVEKKGLNIRSGFIHVPFLPSQTIGKSADMPAMSLEDETAAVIAALKVIAS